MLKTYKYRLMPTKKQATLINKHIGSCRLVYNLALEVKNYAYTTQRKNLTCFDLISQLPELIKECEWLCTNCGTLHDRDINAAMNIKNYSIRDCAGVRRIKPVELPRLRGAVKQENILV